MLYTKLTARLFILACTLACVSAFALNLPGRPRLGDQDQDDQEPVRQAVPSTPPPTTAPPPASSRAIPDRPPGLTGSERPLVAGAETYTIMLYRRRFDEIDRAADDARARGTTLSDGQPLLGAIYDGVAGCFCGTRQPAAVWAQRRALLDEWRRKSPRSLTAEVASIALHMAYAWNVRARGWNNADEERQVMEAFANEANTAYQALENASPAARADPGAYYIRLHIGLALGWPKSAYTAVYKEATAKYPLYLPLYFAASNYYDERWYGSAEEHREFLDDAVAATRARLGESLYARVHWSMQTDEGLFLRKVADWDRMRAGFERIVADYPDNWNFNNYMRFACIAKDYDTVLRLGPHIVKPAAEAWQGRGSYLTVEYCLKSAKFYLKK